MTTSPFLQTNNNSIKIKKNEKKDCYLSPCRPLKAHTENRTKRQKREGKYYNLHVLGRKEEEQKDNNLMCLVNIKKRKGSSSLSLLFMLRSLLNYCRGGQPASCFESCSTPVIEWLLQSCEDQSMCLSIKSTNIWPLPDPQECLPLISLL